MVWDPILGIDQAAAKSAAAGNSNSNSCMRMPPQLPATYSRMLGCAAGGDGLASWAIALIVVGSLAVVGAIVGAVVWRIVRSKSQQAGMHATAQEPAEK